MKLLKVKPYDNTFFRLGNNFELKISNVIRTKNIAYPSTFFGAIFSAILANNDIFRKKFLSKKNNTDHLNILQIKQIYLYDENQDMTYIRSPKDLFINRIVKYGQFKEINKEETSLGYSYYLEEPDGDELERGDHYFVSINDFYEKYRYKMLDRIEFKHEDDIFIKNLKTGLHLDKNTSSIKESYLYTIEQTEFKSFKKNYWSNNWSFIVEYTINYNFVKEKYNLEIKDLDTGELKLGGESKVCKYEIIKNRDIDNFRLIQNEDVLRPKEKLKVIFTSDSYFKKGFDKIFNDEIKIKALVNDKPIYIGGFDLAKNEEKVMFKGYSAGSIILLQNISQNNIEINKYLKRKIAGEFTNGFNQYIYIKGE